MARARGISGVAICCFLLCLAPTCVEAGGTDRFLRQMFIGRCYTWIMGTNAPLKYLSTPTFCEDVYSTFLDAWLPTVDGGPNTTRTPSLDPSQPKCLAGSGAEGAPDFSKLFEKIPPQSPMSRSMLWSGLFGGTEAVLSGQQLGQEDDTDDDFSFPLEATLPGSIMDGLSFCPGDPTVTVDTGYEQGMDPKNCPKWGPGAPGFEFWYQLSCRFAQQIRGDFSIFAVKRSEDEPIIREQSFLWSVEIPTIVDGNNEHTVRLYVFAPNTTRACQDKSVKMLRDALKEKQYEVTCDDRPNQLIIALCTNERRRVTDAICKRLRVETLSNGAIATIAVVCTVVGGIAVVVLYRFKQRRRFQSFLMRFDDQSSSHQLLDDPDEAYYFQYEEKEKDSQSAVPLATM
eukprot:m.36249 g.36249  ORF g.36249 m.36249 type:complete len:400 (-) comp9978_c0_seq2:2291-3490(-)